MNISPDCIPCIFRQILNAMRQVSDNTDLQRQALFRLANYFAAENIDDNPSIISQPAYRIVSALTGIEDPYIETKRESNRLALLVKPDVESEIAKSSNKLETALHAAAAGNTIDSGIGHEYNIGNDILEMMRIGFKINDIHDFEKELGPGRKLLYLGDNAGEIVFDALLVAQILKTGTEVVFAVKSGPIINDATMEDAISVGLTSLVDVIETGGNDIGINFRNVTDRFRNLFESSDIILAKGHGNFETCEHRRENLYFLLKAKCDYVANTLGVNVGDIVFRKNSNR